MLDECQQTRQDSIGNDIIKEKIGVALLFVTNGRISF